MATKLDTLFREGLDSLEVTPKESSWLEVQKELKSSKKVFLVWPMGLAASVILVIAAFILFYTGTEEKKSLTQDFIEIDHPKVSRLAEINVLPVTSVIVEETSEDQKSRVEQKSPAAKVDHHNQNFNYKLYSLNGKSDMVIDAVLPVSLGLRNQAGVEVPVSKITITYIASNQLDTLKANRFTQLVNNFSREVSPADFLADIRDAKDNLFRKN